jgi:hypothetical protein
MWEAKHTARWVGVIEGLEMYAELFLMHDINGLKLLALDGMTAMQLGISQMGAKAKLMDEINQLSKQPSADSRQLSWPTKVCCDQGNTGCPSICTGIAQARTVTQCTY